MAAILGKEVDAVTVAIYARVSTDRQETENQLRELREYAARQDWSIYREYVDKAVRRKDPKPERELLFLHAHQKRFDIVLFWALDRFLTYDSNHPAKEALDSLARLRDSGVGYVSFQEQYISSLGPMGEVAIALFSVISKLEIDRDSERIKAGLARTKAKGTVLGRPKKDYSTRRATVLALRSQGLSWREIGEKAGIPSTAARRLAKIPMQESGSPTHDTAEVD